MKKLFVLAIAGLLLSACGNYATQKSLNDSERRIMAAMEKADQAQ